MKNYLMKLVFMCFVFCVLSRLINVNVYAANEIGLDIGQSYTLCEPSDCVEIISYASDNNSVVSVSSDGVISGIQPGEAVITIDYLNSSNDTCQCLYIVEVYLVPGVYRIKNSETDKYLSLSDIKIKKDSSLTFIDSGNIGTNSDAYLMQLWYVYSDNSVTEFTIQPYIDKNSILIYNEYKGCIEIDDMPSFMEYNYSENSIWSINSNVIETSQKAGYSRNKLNELTVYGEGTENDKWEYEQITVLPNGLRLIDEHYENANVVQTRYISKNSTKSLNDLKIRVLSYYNGESGIGVTWSSSDESIATVDSYTGEVTGVKAGTVTITATYYPGATQYTETYTLTVTPHQDGMYTISNLLGYNGIKPIYLNEMNYNGYFLMRNSGIGNNTYLYLQSTIDGTYKISIADNKTISGHYWLARNFENNSLEILDFAHYVNNKSTWTFRENDLGTTVLYKGNENYSWRLLDSPSDVIDLCYPDYEDYESMWSINKVIEHSIPTIYIHPYYDSQFLSNYGNDKEAVCEELYDYLNYAKNIFVRELGINVIIEEPIELVLPELEEQKLNKLGVVNINGVDDEYIFKNYFSGIIQQFASDDEYHLNTHKYILYQAYPHVTANGISYVPRTGNPEFGSYIYYGNGNSRNWYATLHELAHTIGAVDHYHNNDGENGECTVADRCTTCGIFSDKRPEFCAINYDYYDQLEPFCNDCVLDMKAALYFMCMPTGN